MNNENAIGRTTAIVNANVFDGENSIGVKTVVLSGETIQSVGDEVPGGAVVIDAMGKTLLPGLIDSHVHTDMDGLRDALKFGVTTELEMNGHWPAKQRREIAERTDMADLRTCCMGVTPKGGHPTEYMDSMGNSLIRLYVRFFYPSVETPEAAVKFVDKQIAGSADYIKVFIEDGSCIGFPGLPVLRDDVLKAAIDEAHSQNKLTVVHATTLDAAKKAVDAGIDCLGHLFFDSVPTPELITKMKAADIFIIPTLVTLSTAFGNNAAELAADERVRARLDQKWIDALSRSMNVYPQGKMEDAYAAIRALKNAGVDILAGSDVSDPLPILGGLAHGVSLHHELRLLVAAGLTPAEALRAATSTPARRFGLVDRGRIAPGARADLLLVKGDPLANISDTLSIDIVWRSGVQYRS
ncbi:MAG: amidohydrolase family protein [Clostridiales bacterium]|nr:amidohydrolase family protein [Clostridiales bacterium]